MWQNTKQLPTINIPVEVSNDKIKKQKAKLIRKFKNKPLMWSFRLSRRKPKTVDFDELPWKYWRYIK